MDAGDDGNLVATQRILSLVDEGASSRLRRMLGIAQCLGP